MTVGPFIKRSQVVSFNRCRTVINYFLITINFSEVIVTTSYSLVVHFYSFYGMTVKKITPYCIGKMEKDPVYNRLKNSNGRIKFYPRFCFFPTEICCI